MGTAPVEVTPDRLRRLVEACRASADVAEGDRQARDEAIYAADQAGWTENRLKRETGMSLGHIQRIISRQTARHQAVRVDG